MSREKLKSDLVILKNIFPKNHKVFQTLSATMDEITMKFIENGNEHIINGSFSEFQTSTIWFSESDKVGSVLERLTDFDSPKEPTGILNDVSELLSQLCELFKCERPVELDALAGQNSGIEEKMECEQAQEVQTSSLSTYENEKENENENENSDAESEEVMEFEMENEYDFPPTCSNEPPTFGCLMMLDQLRKRHLNWRRSWCEKRYYGINELDHHLMTEVQEMYRSPEYRTGMYEFEVDPDKDMTRTFTVRLYKGHDNVPLTELMPNMVETLGQDYLLFRFRFGQRYPFEPMIIELISHQDYVLFMWFQLDLWLPTMSVRSVLKQIADKMVASPMFLGSIEPVSQKTWGFKIKSHSLPERYILYPRIGLLSTIKFACLAHHNYDVLPVLKRIYSSICSEN